MTTITNLTITGRGKEDPEEIDTKPYRDFIRRHGQTVELKDTFLDHSVRLAADGWTWAPADHTGRPVEPENEEEAKQLRIFYWTERERLCRLGIRSLNEQRADFNAGVGGLLFDSDYYAGRKAWLKSDEALCRRMLQQIEDGTDDNPLMRLGLGYLGTDAVFNDVMPPSRLEDL